MEESIDIPDIDDVQDLATAKFLLKYVVKALEAQTRTIEALTHEIAELKRALFGKKSERVVPVDREIRTRNRRRARRCMSLHGR